MGTVHLAIANGPQGFAKLLVLKELHADLDDPAFRSMLLEEARLAAKLNHPNIAQTYEIAEDSDGHFIVMEFLEGQPFSRARKAMPLALSLLVLSKALDALEYIHTLYDYDGTPLGVVHRDISPHNVFVTYSGEVKVCDFGIAKATAGSDTATGTLKGKLAYMAPEAARGQRIDRRADVFSAGVMVWEAATGDRFWAHASDIEILQGLLDPHALSNLVRRRVTPPLDTICAKAMAYDPDARYPSALAFRKDLERAIDSFSHQATPRTLGEVMTSAFAGERDTQQRTIRERMQRLNQPPSHASARANEPLQTQSRVLERPSFDAELAPLPARPPQAIAHAATPDAVSHRLASFAEAPPAAQPERSAETPEPPMMDVRALVKRAAVSPRQEAPPTPTAPYPRGGALDLSGSPRRAVGYVGPATRPVAPAPRLGRQAKRALFVGTAAALFSAGTLLVAPSLIRERVIAMAQKTGFQTSIDHVSLGLHGITLSGVSARLVGPFGHAKFDAREVVVKGLWGRTVQVHGLDVALNGRASETLTALDNVYRTHRDTIAGATDSPRLISVIEAHVVWTGIVGDGSQMKIGALDGEIESGGSSNEIHHVESNNSNESTTRSDEVPLVDNVKASLSNIHIHSPHATLGPWAGTFERAASTARFRLLFDPPVPDGPNALVVWGDAGPHLTVKIPRSPLARLGIRTTDFAPFTTKDTELELKLDGGQSPLMRLEGTGRLDLYRTRVTRLKTTVDVHVEGLAHGAPGKPLELQQTRATVGPFSANVTGTVDATDLGLRLNTAWHAAPIPCDRLARAQAETMGPIAVGLRDIARAVNVARVTGTVVAEGTFTFDSRTPSKGNTTLTAREDCALSLLGKE
jgi:serine/threonine-protein kinase